MSKDYSILDYRKLKKLSSLAKMYKDGVSREYMHKLKESGQIDVIKIDGVQFVNLDNLSPEIRKHLKKL
jgi:hypothetical protein